MKVEFHKGVQFGEVQSGFWLINNSLRAMGMWVGKGLA